MILCATICVLSVMTTWAQDQLQPHAVIKDGQTDSLSFTQSEKERAWIESDSTDYEMIVEIGNEYKIAKNYEEAVRYYRLAAENGYARGQWNLGAMYDFGYGVTQDYQKAVDWYRKAAEQGDAVGQCCLGFMYENGYGVTQDYQEAFDWYRKAAE